MKNRIKDLARQIGMDMCGIAPVDRFANAPEGEKPEDILPGCKSVIVIGVRLLDGAVQVNFRDAENGQSNLKGIYGTYAYAAFPNFELAYSCYSIAQFIERNTGEVATPCPTGPMTNGEKPSVRHAAVAAGLGTFGWLSLVLTPEYGPRNRFGVILTTAEIEPDPMYDGPKLCNPQSCGICTKVCPSHALGEYGKSDPNQLELGGIHFEYAKINRPRCSSVLLQLRKKYGAREDFVSSDDPTAEEISEAMQKVVVVNQGLQPAGTWHCGRCLSYCPVGKWGSKFKARGLSGGIGAIRIPGPH